jgi:hypothetical protein
MTSNVVPMLSLHSPSIATKQEFFAYLRTDMGVLANCSGMCINELRRQEIIEWE